MAIDNALSVALPSHPTWVRGLKSVSYHPPRYHPKSHPTWVRGLKLLGGAGLQPRRGVAPHVGAWIEITTSTAPIWSGLSHPTWVRGLKSLPVIDTVACNRHGRTSPVAPHVGAWIEIVQGFDVEGLLDRSHPTWVRGLKSARKWR